MEIIERTIKTKKRTIDPTKNEIQISYNNFGHLTIRFFERGKEDKDTIIVFTAGQTGQIIRFVRNIQTSL